ncbi:MAG: hypothetical protein QM742_05125 [Aquabacterium sp.]
MSAPGEPIHRPSPDLRRILLAVLVLALLLAAALVQKESLNEYYLYFSEDRQPVTFSFTELSEDWTEASIKERFAGLPMSCRPYLRPGAHACGVDVASHNGVSAMFVTFIFEGERLYEVAVNIPLWSLSAARERLRDQYGPPLASQWLPHDGVRLEGWQLANGSALFLNRDLNVMPPYRNAIYWRSASACSASACIRSGR